jgi:hypothetical protein
MKDAQPEERIQVIPLSAEEQRHFSELVPELKMAPIWAKDERR